MDKKEESDDICGKLRELRRSRGLTVDTLAKKMGENSQKVGRIERGARSITLDYLVRVSKALEAPIESFFEKEKTNNTEEPSDSSPNILNDIVILIEEHYKNSPIDANKKALIISKVYELAIKFPKESRHLFLDSVIDFMNCLDV